MARTLAGGDKGAGTSAQPTTAGIEEARVPASNLHLAGHLAVVERRVQWTAARRRSMSDPSSDPWPGLYVSDAKVQRLLEVGSTFSGLSGLCDADADASEGGDEDGSGWMRSEVEAVADAAEAAGERVRLRVLQRRFGIDAVSLGVLVVALAPELDRRYEQLYGYLNDDVTRRRATVGLALELADVPLGSVRAHRILGSGSPLVRSGLLTLEGGDRPWPGRELRVPDRVVSWCLGDDELDPVVASFAELWTGPAGPNAPTGAADALGRWLAGHEGIVYLRESPGSSGRWFGTTAWASAGARAMVCHLERIAQGSVAQGWASRGSVAQGWASRGSASQGSAAVEMAVAAAREAALQEAGLVAGPLDALGGSVAAVIEALTRVRGSVILHGRGAWDDSWSRHSPMTLSVPPATAEELAHQWSQALQSPRSGPRLGAGLDPVSATAQFRLSPEQVQRAAAVARSRAELEGSPIDAQALQAGAREFNNPGLERLAQRIEPAVSWDDLVVPYAVGAHLREIAARARHRDQVLGQWGMRPGGRRGKGVVALFCGVSGTGKTMSAEVLAGDLGIDLYVVDLASVVDKYVGETEKNLERVFSEADGVGGVLLFDEADALFAKRSEVRGANDRYANLEVAYLLQRMERFDGLALLSTNLRSNIDEAFVRRLDAVVEFPMPDAPLRRSLWECSLAPAVPRAGDLDLDFLSTAFTLSGGNIRSVCLSAAYIAAESGEPVTMTDVVRCLAREYRKLGRLCTEAEFGRYWPLVAD
ncbi:MAG: ATP-binding protein [Actinomycetota bacterium]|nr:ATP-binding protein [Actinomycetota bacterium]